MATSKDISLLNDKTKQLIEGKAVGGTLTITKTRGAPTLGDLRRTLEGRIWTDAFAGDSELLQVGEKFDYME